jgi:hypothetical protein
MDKEQCAASCNCNLKSLIQFALSISITEKEASFVDQFLTEVKAACHVDEFRPVKELLPFVTEHHELIISRDKNRIINFVEKKSPVPITRDIEKIREFLRFFKRKFPKMKESDQMMVFDKLLEIHNATIRYSLLCSGEAD